MSEWFNIKVNEEVKRKIQLAAALRHMTQQQIVELAMNEYVKNHRAEFERDFHLMKHTLIIDE